MLNKKLSKGMMPCFSEVYAVESEWDVPRTGVDKRNVQTLCKALVFLAKAVGFGYQCVCGNPGTPLHRRWANQQDLLAAEEKGHQKVFHPVATFLCGCTLQKIVGTEHHKQNIHRGILGKQRKAICIAWDLSAVHTGVDDPVTGLACQQIHPTAFGIITVAEETSGIIAIGIGISKAHNLQSNHLLFVL